MKRDPLTPGAGVDELEVERSLLAAILLHNESFSSAAAIVSPSDFFRKGHGVLFAAYSRMAARGEAIDLVTLKSELTAEELGEVGGPAYITALVDGRMKAVNIEHYAERLRKTALSRRAFAAAMAFIRTVSEDPAAIGNGVGSQFAITIQKIVDAARSNTPGRRLFRSARELARETVNQVTWLVSGLVALGAITELSGKAKSAGKTTLIAFIVRCVLGRQLCFGVPAESTAVVFLTEQPPMSFREVLSRAGLLDREDLSILCHSDVAGYSWPEIVRLAEREADRINAKLIVVDTLPQFAGLRGDSENNAGDALAVLAPIQQSVARGYAWLITRHDRKGASEVGESGRGSSAFTGGVDIALRLSRPDGNTRPTIRKLEGLSRFTETPRCVLLEKVSVFIPNPAKGVWAERIDSFTVLGDEQGIVAAETRVALLQVLPENESTALTEQQISEAVNRPRTALQRALKALLSEQVIDRVGKGRKGNPYRFFKKIHDSAQTSPSLERFGRNESEGSL